MIHTPLMTSVDSAPVNQLPRPPPQRRRPRRGGHNSSVQRGGAQTAGSVPQTPETNGFDSRPINRSLHLRPASVAPSSTSSSAEASSAEASANENGHTRNARGRGSRAIDRGRDGGLDRAGGVRRGRGLTGDPGTYENGQGYGHHNLHNGHNGRTERGLGRQSGGRLTQEEPTSGQTVSILQADAPEFHPGQQHQQRSFHTGATRAPQLVHRQPQAKPSRARRQSVPKSTAPDIATRTHEDIANGIYECPICTNEVARNSKVWSCKTCWSVFHLSCISRWSKNEGSTQVQRLNENGDLPPPRQWRCPGCNLPKDVLPSNYTCWCAKEVDPQPIPGIPPHSCGQTCGKSRILPKKCPHPCELLCHAGPCPPCSHMGPQQSCFCGKNTASQRCIDTNYDTGWTCGKPCGDLLPCGEHYCQKPCHEGLCGACEVPIDCRCYCGKDKRIIACCERSEERPSKRLLAASDDATDVDEWTGTFDCENECQREYDCGKHACEKKCHPQDLTASHCPRSPDVVTHCPCGKSLLGDVSITPRNTCEDPIPNCDKQCLKRLPCGHPCLQTCHADDCMPCFMTVSISCRCGRTQSSTVCHQGNEEQPQCMRACRATLNCGRHECGERCCSGEKKAAERQATKRKLRPLGASRALDEGVEAEHICTRSCGRKLKCGSHNCPELCHRGPCGSCREAIFEEISCHCGKTVLQPPLPCGTSPPPCGFDCDRPRECGHPKVPHNCHGDDEACPKCPFLAQKACLCGKKTLKNQPCWLLEVRCGEVCGRKLKCGSHFCRKQCHRPGECEDVGKSCQQVCGKGKKICGHPCEEQCHAPSSCREDKPCQNKMFITCDCQHLKQEVKCNASKTSEGNTKKSLDCDDECARLARNHKLALALNIDPEAHKDDHIPYSNDTLKMFRESVKWCQTQEREIRVFAADENEKRLRFKPMPSHQRAFLHSLSDDFGFDSESVDPEPHRHVAVFKTPRFVMAPMKTLAECVRIRISAEASSVPIAESQSKLRANNETYNGFLLSNPRFGLTLEELRADCAASLESTSGLSYDISFLPSEEIVIKARPVTSATIISSSAIEAAIKTLKPSLSASISSKHLATSVQLCALDNSLNITRREMDDPANNGGWSQVAAKGAAPRTAPRQTMVGEKSVYTVLGSKLRDAKKKKEEMKKAKESAVVDDWEEEVKRQEEEEKAMDQAQSREIVKEGADDGTERNSKVEEEMKIDKDPSER
ncbi:hypothetical protein BDR22DRAFT_876082 [Usnea florida]